MKVRASVRKICENCRLIRRKRKSWLFVQTQSISKGRGKIFSILKMSLALL